MKSLNNPLLILNDAPEHHTGLARIGRDLASLACTLPQFRTGYLGRGAVGKKKFPWTSYAYPENTQSQWGEAWLEQVWTDFSGGEPGIIFSLWDASRMLWFGQPQTLPAGPLQKFLGSGRNFQKWGYFPVDGAGPDGVRLGCGMSAAVAGYDRVLAASEWGMNVLHQSGRRDADWIPHGLWMDRFRIADKSMEVIGWNYDQIHVGCNMANQARKDWPVAMECIAVLRQTYGNRLHFWAHTDSMLQYWNLYSLALDYGISDCTEFTLELSDDQLALRYSACDCTILPSAGEGFGFPIAESMACGTACIVTGYAAGQELVDESWRVSPVAFRVDTQHNVQRAVLSGHGFAQAAQIQIEKKRDDWEGRGEEIRAGVEHLDWNKLQVVWKKWLLDGLRTA